MKKTVVFWSILATTACIAACNERVLIETCIPGCHDDIAVTCDADGTKHEMTCEFGCDSNACKEKPAKNECVPGCSDNTAVTCDADGTKHEQTCEFGCDGELCKSNPVQPVCVPGCSDNKLVTCDEDGTKHEQTCEFGCDGELCKSNPVQPVCVPGCSDNKLVTCDEDGTKHEQTCEFGCDGDAQCKSQLSCKDELCANGGKCDRGICVNDLMRDPSSRGLLTAVQEFCDGDTLYYLPYDDPSALAIYAKEDCGDKGGCILYEETSETTGMKYLKGSCRGQQADRCTHEGEAITACEIHEDHSFALREHYICKTDTEGKFYLSPDVHNYHYTEDCPTKYCNADYTDCETAEYQCKKTDSGEEYYEVTQNNKVIYSDHCFYNEKCLITNGYATCEETCDPGQPISYFCANNQLSFNQCISNGNDQYISVATTQYCNRGCDDNQCHTEIETEKACDWNTFVSYEKDGKLITCVKGEITELSFSCPVPPDVYFTAPVKAIIDNMPICYIPCEAEGKPEATCIWNQSYQMTSTCIKSTFSPEVPFITLLSEHECSHGCDPQTGSCINISQEEEKPCDESFEPHCDNQFAFNCSKENVTVAEDCGDGVCLVDNGEAKCYSLCPSEQRLNYFCEKNNGEDHDPPYFVYENKCSKIGDFWVITGGSYPEDCYNGCDETTGKCKTSQD